MRWRPVAVQVKVATLYDQRMCTLQSHIDAYRDAYDLAAAQIQRPDPTALKVAMETTPRSERSL
jgi:hypothetical protein